MGLDNYFYSIENKTDKKINVEFDRTEVEEIFYFRRNHSLHEFLESYFKKDSTEDFNFPNNLVITKDILMEIRKRFAGAEFDNEAQKNKFESFIYVLQIELRMGKQVIYGPDY